MSEQARARQTIRFGVFELDLAAAELRKRGRRVKLEAQPFQVLSVLVRRSGDLVTRDDLRKELWPEDTFVEFDHSVNTAVRKIRQALDDSPRTPRYIETEPRKGYRFIAAVDAEAEPVTAPQPVPPPPTSRLWLLTLAILVIAGAAGTIGYFVAAGRNAETPALRVVPLTT